MKLTELAERPLAVWYYRFITMTSVTARIPLTHIGETHAHSILRTFQ